MPEYPSTPQEELCCLCVISLSSYRDIANHSHFPGYECDFPFTSLRAQAIPKPSLQLHRPSALTSESAAPSTFIQQGSPANQEHVQTGGKIKYNLPREEMKVNPNRHTSKGFLFATFIPCAEGTIVSKRFALLNETGTREAFLGKIILKNHQKPIPALQTSILNKEM